MNFPRRYLSPTEGHGNTANDKQKDLAGALNDESIISPQEQQERFASAPKTLQDTFILQEDGGFLVKTPEDSQIMEGHLRDLPIVPGIVLKRLFLHQTQTKPEGVVTTQFLWGVFSWQNITVRKDGIYNPAGKKIVDISIDTKEDISQVKDTRDISYMPMYEEEMDDYLLQQKTFRFVSYGEKDGVMKNDSRFRGRFDVPENFLRAEDGKINPEIIEEIGAQIGAYVTGPDLNKDIPMIQTIENKVQLNPESKVFTFKLGRSVATETSAKTGETIYIKWRVITFDPNGKEAHFCYSAENEQRKQLITGEIKGNIVPVKMLIRAYGQIKNSPQK